LKVMLLSLAIADDIGSVVVIAAAYTHDLSLGLLGLAGLGLATVYAARRLGVRSVAIYWMLGSGVWLAFLKAGVHPTVAGVILGLMTPAEAWVKGPALSGVLVAALRELPEQGEARSAERREALRLVAEAAREAVSPLERLETALHPWVGFVIM